MVSLFLSENTHDSSKIRKFLSIMNTDEIEILIFSKCSLMSISSNGVLVSN